MINNSIDGIKKIAGLTLTEYINKENIELMDIIKAFFVFNYIRMILLLALNIDSSKYIDFRYVDSCLAI